VLPATFAQAAWHAIVIRGARFSVVSFAFSTVQSVMIVGLLDQVAVVSAVKSLGKLGGVDFIGMDATERYNTMMERTLTAPNCKSNNRKIWACSEGLKFLVYRPLTKAW